MKDTLITLAQLHYDFGLINYEEFNERFGVALWLADELPSSVIDPRNESIEYSEERETCEKTESISQYGVSYTIHKDNREGWLEFLFAGIWIFTKADLDSYPSVPHGHYKKQNNKWPKLNPYTGRVFVAKHQENQTQRLSKKQMKSLWSDAKFRSFCREMIIWYQQTYQYYEFPVKRPSRLPRW